MGHGLALRVGDLGSKQRRHARSRAPQGVVPEHRSVGEPRSTGFGPGESLSEWKSQLQAEGKHGFKQLNYSELVPAGMFEHTGC